MNTQLLQRRLLFLSAILDGEAQIQELLRSQHPRTHLHRVILDFRFMADPQYIYNRHPIPLNCRMALKISAEPLCTIIVRQVFPLKQPPLEKAQGERR